MKPALVVDTNVLVVANSQATKDARCAEACIEALEEARAKRRVVLDIGGEILKEYRRRVSPKGQLGAGDAFLLYLYKRQYTDAFCMVTLTPIDEPRQFAEYPSDPALDKFHKKDCKFVAASLASGTPAAPIANAKDSDWAPFQAALAIHGVTVWQVCDPPAAAAPAPTKRRKAGGGR